jgi:hypothetical protein
MRARAIRKPGRTKGPSRLHSVPLSKPDSKVAASVYSPVRTYCRLLGGVNWARCSLLRHAHDAANEGDADLPTDKEPTRRPTSSRAHQAGERRTVSRH